MDVKQRIAVTLEKLKVSRILTYKVTTRTTRSNKAVLPSALDEIDQIPLASQSQVFSVLLKDWRYQRKH